MPKYDAAVVGAGLGGLAAAALLSSAKKKVIVIEHSESVDNACGVFERDDFTFFASPPLSYGFEPGGAIHELAAELGIIQDVSVHSPSYQVALPDRRITLYPEVRDTLEEFRREFPREIDGLARFYRDLHKDAVRNTNNRFWSYLSRHRTAARLLRKYRFSPELMAFFDVQSRYFFQKSADELSLASLITLCDGPPRYLSGGFKKFADQLYGVILREGGDIRCSEKTVELAVKNDRVTGLKTARGIVETETIILNRAHDVRTTVLFIGLRRDVIPIGMCRHVLFLSDYARPHEMISLSLNTENDETAPPGMTALTVSFRSSQESPAGKPMLMNTIGKLIPFLSEYTLFSEEYRAVDTIDALPESISFHPYRSSDGTPLLFRGSSKNVYLLRNEHIAPLQVISAVHRFVIKGRQRERKGPLQNTMI